MSVRKSGKIIAGTPRTTGGVEIGDMGFAPLGIDESLNLRRYLNGQVISQTQFVAFTNKVKSAIALYPNLAATETNWQAEKTNSKLGQCGKFVIDDTAQTIRLPCVVNAQGLVDLALIGGIKSESLPNITGSFATAVTRTITSDPSSATPSGCFTYSNYGSLNISTGANKPSVTGLNASRSSPTYQDNAPVQQEAVQYPYYIQVATGVEETLPAIREYQVNNSDYFGKSMYSDVAPDNASWLASNGSYNSRSVYPDYYDWLNSKIGQVITANGGKVVLSTDTITDYDFVVNQNDQTFRLPLLNGEEDLPGNTFSSMTYNGHSSVYTAPKNGHFSIYGYGSTTYIFLHNETSSSYSDCAGSTDQNSPCGVSVKCKKGDTIRAGYYGGTITSFGFTPAIGNGTLYYYVGDTVQDASLINTGAVLGQLSNKADIDASNFNADGKSLLSGLGMPSNRYIDLTLGASGTTYTAPANGYFVVTATSTSASRAFVIFEKQRGICNGDHSYSTDTGLRCFIPCQKGKSTILSYGNVTITNLWFIYAEGEN